MNLRELLGRLEIDNKLTTIHIESKSGQKVTMDSEYLEMTDGYIPASDKQVVHIFVK